MTGQATSSGGLYAFGRGRAVLGGGWGYLRKEADGDDVLRALLGVARGEAVFGPRIAQRVVSFFAGSRTAAATPTAFPQPTGREREVLDLLARAADRR